MLTFALLLKKTDALSKASVIYFNTLFYPHIPQASQALFVTAQPPRAVSLSSTGILLPTLYIVSSISSNGMSCVIPASAISVATKAFATPEALRF